MMSYCSRCGSSLDADARFCPTCGYALAQPADDFTKEQELLNFMDRMMRFEQKAWRIVGHFFLWAGAALATLGLLLTLSRSLEVTIIGFVYAVVFGICYIPLGVIGLKAAGKISYYRERLYFDVMPAYRRCNSVGMLVFCVLFNTIAAVFYIINFTRVRSNEEMISRIAKHQQEAR